MGKQDILRFHTNRRHSKSHSELAKVTILMIALHLNNFKKSTIIIVRMPASKVLTMICQPSCSNNTYEVTSKKATSKHMKRRLLDIVIQVSTMVTMNAKFCARQSTKKNLGRILTARMIHTYRFHIQSHIIQKHPIKVPYKDNNRMQTE